MHNATNILFSAAFKRVGIPAQLLDLVAPGVLTPCTSDAIMAEYLDVPAQFSGRMPPAHERSWS
ncbi:MAG: hypothetical protein ABSF64_12645 [Bryobacteraceae bacterium]|jgi:predicted nucleic acid-binding protein